MNANPAPPVTGAGTYPRRLTPNRNANVASGTVSPGRPPGAFEPKGERDVKVLCRQCGSKFECATGAFNRAAKHGAPLFCSRRCAGLSRRKCKTAEQKRAEKAVYDKHRRSELADVIRAKKAEYHRRTYDPIVAAVKRKSRMPSHVEYCRRPEYREWKRGYDQKYRAALEYGEFADCFILMIDIRAEALAQMTDYEIRMSNGTLGKNQKRRRDYERLNSNKPEIGALGSASIP